MLDEFFVSLIERAHPCKTCLVQATCNPAPHDRPLTMIKKKCNKYTAFLNTKDLADTTGNNIEVFSFITFFVLGVILFIITFGLGLWKWVELISN